MPELVRLYIRNVIIGFVIALIFVGLLLWFNVANLWHLVTATTEGPIAVVMLVVFNTVVFSGVQFGIAVMLMARDDDDDTGHRQPESQAPSPLTALRPVRVDASSGLKKPFRDITLR